MPNKPQTYSELAEKASLGVAHSVDEWCMFLKSQAKFYKYDYSDQLMIYAQRPDASLCLTFDDWTKTMNRYIHKGSKGIGLIDNSGDEPRMKYVFDISDTSERFNSRPLTVWRYDPDKEKEISEAVSSFYGFENSGNFDDILYKASRRMARQYAHDRMDDFHYIVDGSSLEEYDEQNRYSSVYNLAKNSIAYITMERCGINPEYWFQPEDFIGIHEFNTSDVINFVGSIVSECSEEILRTVEKTVKHFERSQSNDIHREKQPDVSVSDTQRESENEPGQIRTDEEEIPEGKEEVALGQPDSEGRTEPAPERNSEKGRNDAESGNIGIGDSEEDNLQLNLFGEAFIDMYDEEAESKLDKLFSASSVISDEDIESILQIGSNTEYSKEMITAEFSKDKDLSQKALFLQKIYHGGYGYRKDDARISTFYDEEGIHISNGTRATAKGSILLTWEDAANKIDDMLNNGRFATINELKGAVYTEGKKIADALWYMERDLSEEGRAMFTTFDRFDDVRGFPDATEAIRLALREKPFLEKIIGELKDFVKAYDNDHNLLRFSYHHVHELSERVSELLMPRKTYGSKITESDLPVESSFITEDEIDRSFCGGSGVSGGKMRIYDFFESNKGTKERADFLKNEYGTGGRSHAVSNADHSGESHDAKGVILTKQNCETLKFSWNDVAKRIDGLIKQDKYLNEAEKTELENIRNTTEHSKDTIIKAMRAVGYEYDEIDSDPDYLIFNGEGTAATFKNWKETEEWLDGVVFDDPAISMKVERVLYPDRFESEPIKDWYTDTYPDDELGADISEGLTFDGITEALENHNDIYETIGVSDSIVRERIFSELADRHGISYEAIYDKWLDAKEISPSEMQGTAIEKYDKLKGNYPNHICLIQVGDFYECFRDDAKNVAKALDLVLTGRAVSDTDERIPMCGFPVHNEDLYLQKLGDKGMLPVAIARAMADKVQTKETNIPDDAVARAKPSVIKKLEKSKKLIDSNKNSKEKTIKEERRKECYQ